MKTVLVTGAAGFIGRNLCAQLALMDDIEILTYTRGDDDKKLQHAIDAANFIFHVAGVNRPENEVDFTLHNIGLTEEIIAHLKKAGKKTPLLITSSTQANLDNPYGHSKLTAENVVFEWHKQSGAPVFVYRLPGVFGKWARPNYNSVVATFCYNTVNGLPINISDENHSITLAYIDDVVGELVSCLDENKKHNDSKIQLIPRTFDVTLGDLAHRIKDIHDIRTQLIIPNLHDLLNKFLYATYISYLPTTEFSYDLHKNSDDRGWLAEFIKSEYSGQVFVSKTKPGISRGDHWHHTKIEKFLVVSGHADITFRDKRGDSEEVISYSVSGDDMTVLDIPVGYVHAIKNTGDTDLVTLFWANELLDKDHPDTYYEKVSQ